MANARRWVKRLQWAGLGLVVAAILAQAVLDGRPGAEAWVATMERGFLFTTLAVVSIGVLGLILHFLGSLLRPTNASDWGETVLRLQGSRVASAIAVAVLLAFGAAMAFALDQWNRPEDAFDPASPPMTLESKVVIGFFSVVWAFLLLAFTVRAVRNTPWFVLTRRGFHYAPGDAGPGFVRWEDVSELRETEVVSARGRGGPRAERVLAIGLRDPSKYAARYNPILRALVSIAGKLYGAQTGGGADILIDPSHFGDRYEEIKARMRALHAEAQR